MSDRDAIWRFAEHVAGTGYEDLPEPAAVATRTFLDFRPAALRDSGVLELARRVDVVADGSSDPNALVPVTVEITLRDGRRETDRIEVMYGHPARPMARTAQIEKVPPQLRGGGEADCLRGGGADHRCGGGSRVAPRRDRSRRRSGFRSRHPSATGLIGWTLARWEDALAGHSRAAGSLSLRRSSALHYGGDTLRLVSRTGRTAAGNRMPQAAFPESMAVVASRNSVRRASRNRDPLAAAPRQSEGTVCISASTSAPPR